MRLSDARLRRRPAKLIYVNHRLRPWLTEDVSRDRSNRLLGLRAAKACLPQIALNIVSTLVGQFPVKKNIRCRLNWDTVFLGRRKLRVFNRQSARLVESCEASRFRYTDVDRNTILVNQCSHYAISLLLHLKCHCGIVLGSAFQLIIVGNFRY